MNWGVLAPTFDPYGVGHPPTLAAARKAEELGFDSLWVGDHLLAPPPVLDSLAALAACAAVTTRVELGVSVLQLGLRHLVWTAKQLATIDALAPGRLRLGVGIGGEFEDEFVAAGVDRSRRGTRLDEMLGLLPRLLRGEPVDHPLASVRSPGLRPAVSALPRISVGGRSEAALVRTARYGDQWLAMWHDPATVRSLGGRLGELAEKEGRPAPGIAMLVLVNVADDRETAQADVAAGLQGQYRLPLRVVDRWTGYGTAADVAELLAGYRDAGVDEVLLLPMARDPLAQLDRLAEVRRVVG
jgi:alkanesulfonate monooxygenase SsuD/methylene tetrahydromethanopterin reductase-like flavin-dependent oxidoreductase (luciferase family)